MCQLMLGANSTPKNKEFNKVIRAQYEEMKKEPDGAGAFVIDFEGNLQVFRSYDEYDEVFAHADSMLDNARFVGIHTRFSTCGSKDQGNVHFFEDGGYILAHNGTIPTLSHYTTRWDKDWKDIPHDPDELMTREELEDAMIICYGCNNANDNICRTHLNLWLAQDFTRSITGEPSGGKEMGFLANKDPKELKLGDPANACDTLQFLQQIPKPITPKVLAEFSSKMNANGMMVVVEKETNKVFVHVKKEVKSMSDNATFGVFFSFKPEQETSKDVWKSLFGVPVFEKTEKTKIPYKVRDVSYGTFEVII